MSRQSQEAASMGMRRGARQDDGRGLGARQCASDSSIVRAEERWRCPPFSSVDTAAADRILAGSWGDDVAEPHEVSSVGDARFYTVGISLSATTLKFQHDGKIICDGPVMPGSIQITAPGESVKAFYASPCRVMHLFIAPALLSRRYDEAEGQLVRPDLAGQSPRIFRDVAVERLALALQDANPLADTFGRMYADSVCDAIVARLLARRTDGLPARTGSRSAALPTWRLRRAIDFIEANLANPIGLAEVAASTGLTRMHFAAQFRSTTGYSPHAYLLQRRLEHAQKLLRSSEFSVLNIALSCGFSSHAHFTAVFKRAIGEPPNAWRTRIAAAMHIDADEGL
ncbi:MULTISPECIES: AraC family transcriptional regulator [Paraburkholderia]|uniref:AraC family transcriptional regulator n=1 Tax=Paraburkholderia TaxID=1822464 RepID=UPI002257F562|nr:MULTISPECIES: AraC family transcriptional regulator [Paraburkholderia]MCX4161292.1 AraC family transcriptional regulator [Paraburkholderia megapolitana]MDN7156788.1 AraC family transcriptional regulator [Paraburkholderia sp. CHISQ3]MDQ6493833.1 AraC family transcriptional regulator [Paraburkholderia megapolitana]